MESFKANHPSMKKFIIVLLLFVMSFSLTTKRAESAVPYATEITQILNHVELVIQVAQAARGLVNQLEMISHQIQLLRSVATNPQGLWDNIAPVLGQLHNVVQQGQSLAYNLQNISQVFQTTFPGYVPPQNFVNDYQQWTQRTLDTIRGSLMAAGVQSEYLATESLTLNTLKGLSDGAVGQTQAIQAGNMITHEMINQMQKLRQLQMAQMQAQSAYMAHEVNLESSTQAALDEFIHQIPPSGNSESF